MIVFLSDFCLVPSAIRDTTLPFSTKSSSDADSSDLHVPEGTIFCLLNRYAAVHCIPDGDTFRPDRWLDEKTGRFDGTLAWSRPFGSGTRMCYGYRTAVSRLVLPPQPSKRCA
jgi:hypothetical protein